MACTINEKCAFSIVSRAGLESNDVLLLKLTHDSNAAIRVAALKQMCPCRVKDDVDALYDRIFG